MNRGSAPGRSDQAGGTPTDPHYKVALAMCPLTEVLIRKYGRSAIKKVSRPFAETSFDGCIAINILYYLIGVKHTIIVERDSVVGLNGSQPFSGPEHCPVVEDVHRVAIGWPTAQSQRVADCWSMNHRLTDWRKQLLHYQHHHHHHPHHPHFRHHHIQTDKCCNKQGTECRIIYIKYAKLLIATSIYSQYSHTVIQ